MENNSISFESLEKKAREIRREIVLMTTEAGSGHPSSSLSFVEIIVTLFWGGILRFDPKNPQWVDRDRFILSKGHGAPALYAVLAYSGYFSRDLLRKLRKIDSPLEGHPNMLKLPGIEASTGSLGQGLSIGLGHALAGKMDNRDYKVYVLLGDGECDEGQVWEAAMASSHFHLDNLVAIVDYNKYQQSGPIEEVMDTSPLGKKWEAFGWDVIEVDGHNARELHKAFRRKLDRRPLVVLAHTVKGKGVSFLEKDYTYHGRAIKAEDLEKALKEIG